jgi:hypothetical protein
VAEAVQSGSAIGSRPRVLLTGASGYVGRLRMPPQVENSSPFRYRMAPLGVPLEWQAEIAEWTSPHGFADVHLRGPYASWRHRHELAEVAGGTEIRDRVSTGFAAAATRAPASRDIAQSCASSSPTARGGSRSCSDDADRRDPGDRPLAP